MKVSEYNDTQMKMHDALRQKKLRALLGFGFCLAATTVGFAQSLNVDERPYKYPAKPGTLEWKNIPRSGRLAACDIPEEVVSKMSTKALVETVLDYPLQVYVFASSTSHSAGLSNIISNFRGARDLLKRPDAGKHLILQYQLFTDKADRDNTSPEIIKNAFITSILLRDEVLDGMTDSERSQLARLALKNMAINRRVDGISAAEGIPGRLVTKLIMEKDIRFQGRSRVFGKEDFPATEANHFINPRLNFIPEKDFLDKLQQIAEEVKN